MKNNLRKKYLEIRKNIKNKEEKSKIIRDTLLSCPFYKKATSIMVYVSTNNEVDTHFLIKEMLADGKKLSAPKCLDGGKMEARKFSDVSELVPDKFGILAPVGERCEKIDLVIVPGVAFSDDLHRLGYGGGYYDKFLKDNSAITCGLFFCEQKAEIAPEEYDIPLDFIITDTKIYEKR